MLGRLAGQELLMGRPCWDMPWFPYMSIRLAGIWRHRGQIYENRSADLLWPIQEKHHPGWSESGIQLVTPTHRVRHLKSRIHQAEHVVTVTGLQANDVINDIIHLGTQPQLRSKLSLRNSLRVSVKVTSPLSRS